MLFDCRHNVTTEPSCTAGLVAPCNALMLQSVVPGAQGVGGLVQQVVRVFDLGVVCELRAAFLLATVGAVVWVWLACRVFENELAHEAAAR